MSGHSAFACKSCGLRPAARHSASVLSSHAITSTLPLGIGSMSWWCSFVASAHTYSHTTLPSQSYSRTRPPWPPPENTSLSTRSQRSRWPFGSKYTDCPGVASLFHSCTALPAASTR